MEAKKGKCKLGETFDSREQHYLKMLKFHCAMGQPEKARIYTGKIWKNQDNRNGHKKGCTQCVDATK